MISFSDYVQEQARLDANFIIDEGIVGAVKGWVQDKKYDIQDKIGDITHTAHKFHNFVAGAKSFRWHNKYNYTDTQKKAIYNYTNDSADLNTSLAHHGKPYNPKNNPIPGTDNHYWEMKYRNGQQFTHDHMSNAIKANKAHKDMKVFTGIGKGRAKDIGNAFEANKGQPHADVSLKAFTSTSVSKGVAKKFALGRTHGNHSGAVTLKIHVPKGAHVAYIPKHDSAMDDNGFGHNNEGEVVLHPGAKIRVKRNFRKGLFGHNHFEAHLIHDGIKKTKYHPEYDHRDNTTL